MYAIALHKKVTEIITPVSMHVSNSRHPGSTLHSKSALLDFALNRALSSPSIVAVKRRR